ncbi:MAG: amidohydrolase family protein [Acidimicrobiia bacterium]|nr:amidohydrolase family protein [Acidimicrobiia bacterium]
MNQSPQTWLPGDHQPGSHTPSSADDDRLVLADGVLASGVRADVVLRGSVVADVVPAGQARLTGDEVVELDGRLLVPAFVEPHAHLDKALIADTFPNPAGDLNSAIEAIVDAWATLTVEDTITRAVTAARKLVMSGVTAIRTHADVIPENDSKSPEALAEVKRRLRGVCDLQVVAMAYPLTGSDSAIGRLALDKAIGWGADVVGGAPHLEHDPGAALAFILATASEHGLAVDLHMDEVLDVSVQHLAELARQTEQSGMEGKVTASHCVSHGLLLPEEQRELGRILASSGVSVVTLPRTNLFIQARGVEQAPPRSLPGLRALLDSGVTVAAGADNVQDPFYTIGRSDPLETATFLMAVAHFTVDEAFGAVTSGARHTMGLDPIRIAAGSPAELVAVRASSIREAIAEQPVDRIVIHRGKVVARTSTESWVAGE